MIVRHAWLAGLLCVGCSSLTPLPSDEESGAEIWSEGQAAMCQGQPDEAIHCYERSLEADPSLDENHLSLAAAWVEKGNYAAAAPHLARFLAARPDRPSVRSYYAELLVRLNRREEA